MILACWLQSMATWCIYRICGVFTLMSMLATIGQLTDLYLCNFSEFTVVFSDHIGLSVEIVETADIKCIYICGEAFLAWIVQFAGLEWDFSQG